MADNATDARWMLRNVGSTEGSIMATIIASHMNRKPAADANQVWPGIRIHIMDIVQPPGISISQHIDRQKQAVAVTLTAKATTQTAINRRAFTCSNSSMFPSRTRRGGEELLHVNA